MHINEMSRVDEIESNAGVGLYAHARPLARWLAVDRSCQRRCISKLFVSNASKLIAKVCGFAAHKHRIVFDDFINR